MNDKLSQAMDHISDRHLSEAAAPVRHRYYPYLGAIAAVLAFVIAIATFFGPLQGLFDSVDPTTTVPIMQESSTTHSCHPSTISTQPASTTTSPSYSTTVRPTTTQPVTVTLSTDKPVYTVNENILFTISSPSTANTLWIYRTDGQWQKSYPNIENNSYTISFGWEGEYKALVETQVGANTLTSSVIYFTVNKSEFDLCANGHTFENGFCVNCGAKDPDYDFCANGHNFENGSCINCSTADPAVAPTFATITADASTYQFGDTVKFHLHCDGTTNNLRIYKPNVYTETFQNVGNDYSYIPTMPGQYQAAVYTSSGTYGLWSEKITFYVTDDSCTSGHSYTNGVCIRCNAPAPGTGDTSALEEEYGATLKILIPSHNAKDVDAWQNSVVSQFKTYYPNVTVTFVTADWSNWYEKLMVHYNIGDPIDLIYTGVNSQPKLAITGITQPLQNYINMNNPNLKKSVMDECFQYGGSYYVAASEVDYGVIFYNKDMFTAAGLEDPMELYKKGEWNWENFTKLAKALTDKDTDIYGFATEFPYLFYGSNATSTLKLDANGNYSLNMDDPAFIAALELIYDGSNDQSGWSGYDYYGAMATFQAGKAAMLGSFTMYESNINKMTDMYINYGVVPMPYGPNNTQKLNSIVAYGWSIGAGSDCPAHVGKLIDMLVDGNAAYRMQENGKLPAASVQLYAQMANNIFCVNTRDSGIDGGYELSQNVAAGWSVAGAVAEYKPKFQAMIDQYTVSTQTRND